MAGRLSSPAALFDAAADPEREVELAREGLELVARPGMVAPPDLGPEGFLIRRGVGEARLAVLAAVERIVEGRAELEAAGVACEGHGDGVFVEVGRTRGARRKALRIASPEGFLRDDTVLLRPRRPAGTGLPPEEPAVGEPLSLEESSAVEDEPAPSAQLAAAVQALRGRSARPLPEEYVGSLLAPSTTSAIRDDVQRAVADLERRLPTVPTGSARAAALQALLDELAQGLLRAAERAFILDPQRSTLELLPAAERDRYLGFAWQFGDFPGGPAGPNEARARQMFAALTRLRPERRANSGADAAVRADEYPSMRSRLQEALTSVPGESRQRLHRDAADAYVRMRTAASGDGVTLSIHNSYRAPETAQAAAARAGNPTAVASFSSHTLGLAVDLNVSQGSQRFQEISTRPFPNLVGMYKSPVNKWMFLRGEPFGWYPYRPEPWHWEYNPPGFRDRLRAPQAPAARPVAAAPTATAPGAPPEMEAVTDPIPPPRVALALRGTVGRGGQNQPADVRGVQDRLVELRALDAADAAAERPTAAGAVPEASLVKTIEAIERFEREQGATPNGKVELRGATRIDLDRAIPHPSAAELAAVTTERAGLRESASRGLTITGAVGAAGTGNAPADVRAVQQRLVELGHLSAAHGEAPAAGATAPVPQSALRRTIAALRAFQGDVRFWVGRGAVRGAVTPGVASPGDATATLLAQVSVYTIGAGPTQVVFKDHVVSGVTQSASGVMFRGTSQPSAIPLADYQAQGLTPGQAAALKMVSTHEGNFDAINTYDRALVSVGFIQFAGGRGLPPYLALLKARQPARFRDALQRLGVDVEFTVAGGGIAAPRVVVLDPAGGRVLRAAAAEAAIRDDKKLTGALVLSGRHRDVQLVQIEAAIRDYVRPALASRVSWAAGASAPLSDLVRSQKGMAALFDRAIQEGVGAAQRRFERVLARLARGITVAAPRTAPNLAELQAREGDLLSELERDLQAGADIVARVARARAALLTLVAAARAAGATTAALLARSELVDARRAVAEARAAAGNLVNASPPRGSTVDATITAMNARLTAEAGRLALTPEPASPADLATTLEASRRELATVSGPVAATPMFLARIQRIRRSTLDSGLTEVA